MRRFLLSSLLVLAATPAFAAEIPRGFDISRSELVEDFNVKLRERLQRRSMAPASMVAGFTATTVGNITYLQDDGTNGCSGDPFSNAFFNDCVGGAIDAFYGAHPDADPDFLATYLAWNIDAFFAFYSPQSNNVRGIGIKHFAGTDVFDNTPGSNLQGFIFMNSVQLYTSVQGIPPELLFDLIWGQEVGHRWGAFVHFDDNGQDNDDIQGRDYDNGGGHWSYHFDTDWSWMEGNDWKENGDGTFTTDFDTFGQPGYSALDLYVMGLIPASAVPDMFYIAEPTGSADRVDGPQILSGGPKTISGRKRVVTIDDVVRLEGERSPSFAEADRRMQTNLLVILRSTDNPTDATLQSTMAQFETWTTDHFARDVRDLAHIGTNLGPLPVNASPNAALVLPAEGKKGASSTLDASGSSDTDGDSLAYVWDFGDGTGEWGTSDTIDHVFRRSGDLTVTLTVVDAKGGSDTTTSVIAVAAAPKDDGLLGCGCTLVGGAGSPSRGGMLGALALIALALVRRRRA